MHALVDITKPEPVNAVVADAFSTGDRDAYLRASRARLHR